MLLLPHFMYYVPSHCLFLTLKTLISFGYGALHYRSFQENKNKTTTTTKKSFLIPEINKLVLFQVNNEDTKTVSVDVVLISFC